MRIVQNNSGLSCQRQTIQSYWETENSEWQMNDKRGHVVTSAVRCKLILNFYYIEVLILVNFACGISYNSVILYQG